MSTLEYQPIKIEAFLDLHKKSSISVPVSEALVTSFLDESKHQRRKYLFIITGKETHPSNELALKEAIIALLQKSDFVVNYREHTQEQDQSFGILIELL